MLRRAALHHLAMHRATLCVGLQGQDAHEHGEYSGNERFTHGYKDNTDAFSMYEFFALGEAFKYRRTRLPIGQGLLPLRGFLLDMRT
jgi:hypothetical protein